MPPHRSTTFRPSLYRAQAAPTSPRAAKLAANASRTASKPGATSPSTATNVLLLDEFDQRAEGPLRVHKGDDRAPRARTWRLVYARPARGDDGVKGRAAIGDAVAHVVQALTALLE